MGLRFRLRIERVNSENKHTVEPILKKHQVNACWYPSPPPHRLKWLALNTGPTFQYFSLVLSPAFLCSDAYFGTRD